MAGLAASVVFLSGALLMPTPEEFVMSPSHADHRDAVSHRPISIEAIQETLEMMAPVTTHPRLFVRCDDLPRLRQWAVASNPIYEQGLRILVENVKSLVKKGVSPLRTAIPRS
jgi:hypothetical protein